MYCASMHQPLQRVLVKHPRQAFVSQENILDRWQNEGYVASPDYREALKEYEQFLKILRDYVDQVDYLPQSGSTGLDSIYAHDPVKFSPHGAIILNSGKIARQTEAIETKKYLDEQGIPVIGELTGSAVSDGGDLVWVDQETLAIGLGYRTNRAAIQQMKYILNPYVNDIIEVQLPHDQGEAECLHLMSIISIVDDDLAIVYSPLMPIVFRQYLLERGFELIEVPPEEYETLGCNVFALGPRVCMLMEGNSRTKRNLEIAGAVVYEYKGDEISYKGTGGPTCLTCPIVRG